VSKVIDISSNQLARESAGFVRWLKLQNLKAISKTWSSITDSEDINSFYDNVDRVHDNLTQTQSKLKSIELEIQEKKSLIDNINIYNLYIKIYSMYETSNDKDDFFRLHEKEIILFEAARHSISQSNTLSTLPTLTSLKEEIHQLNIQLQKHQADLLSIKNEVTEVNRLRMNLDTYLKTTEKEEARNL
jgi:hypothetical protein